MKEMLNISFKKPKQEIFLALDIGSEAVKALIFKKEHRKTLILGYSLQYLENLGVYDSSDFRQNIIKKTILKTIEEAKKQTDKEINGVFLGLPANILKGKISVEVYKRETEKEEITEKEEKNICQKVIQKTKEKISKIYASEVGILPEDLCFITFKIFETKIDGYEVAKLSGFHGKTLDFKILATFLPRYYLERLEEVFRLLNLKILKIVHQTELLPIFFEAEKFDSIFLDMGGEITQIVLVKNGKLENINEMDSGGKVFSRVLSQTLGLSEEEAKILKEKYSKRELSEGVREKVRGIISQNLQNWFGELKIKLFQSETLLPSKIFLYGGGSQLPEIEEILIDGNWASVPAFAQSTPLEPYLSFVFPPQIEFILPKDLKNIIEIPEKLNNPQFTPTFLLTLYE